jgi:Zn finger protein HypA/HybF involved in hydrogenase expression
MICGSCGSHTVELIAGEEFLIESICLARPIPDSAVT